MYAQSEVWGKVMCLHLSVILFTGDVYPPIACWDIHLLGRNPHGQAPPLGRHLLGRHPRADTPQAEETPPGIHPCFGYYDHFGNLQQNNGLNDGLMLTSQTG